MIPIDLVKNIELFKGLTADELELVRRLANEESYEINQKLFAEGERALNLYIIIDGEVAIKKQIEGKSGFLPVDTVVPGKIFSWSALTEPRTLTASAWTTKPTRLIAFSGDKLLTLFKENTRIGYVVMFNLAHVISQRLRHISDYLLKHSLKLKN